MILLAQTDMNRTVLGLSAFFILGLLGLVLAVMFLLRRRYRPRHSSSENFAELRPQGESATVFMAASMQGVIAKLREQEKELERLHRAEKERAEQTERMSEEVTRNMPAGLLLVNAAGLITNANPAAESALGIRGLTFRRYTEVLGAESDLTRLLTECLKEGRTFRREEAEHTTPQGESRHLGVTISPILQGQGKISGALCLMADLTELSVLQKQMHLKENLAALGELSAGIAHEFKNALATISGYAQMIRSEDAGGVTTDYAGRILDQSRAITHVVTEFLKFARPLELAQEQVALGALVERVAGDMREAFPGVSLLCEGEFSEVLGDEPLLRQALLNLARNGAEAAQRDDGGGQVVLRGWTENSGGLPVQRLSVSDNGPGIPEDDLPKIFRPFYTTKANGTGLGLAVVQKIILQHGGSIEVGNQSQGGAEFIVWLPMARECVQAVDSVSRRI